MIHDKSSSPHPAGINVPLGQCSFRKAESRKTDRYDRLCLDLEEAGLEISNTPLEIGARGYINPRNMTVLASVSSMCRVKSFKKFTRTLGNISLIGSYKVWLARRSNEWAPGSLIRA